MTICRKNSRVRIFPGRSEPRQRPPERVVESALPFFQFWAHQMRNSVVLKEKFRCFEREIPLFCFVSQMVNVLFQLIPLQYATSDVAVFKGRDFVVCRMWRRVENYIIVAASSFDNDIPVIPKKKRFAPSSCIYSIFQRMGESLRR